MSLKKQGVSGLKWAFVSKGLRQATQLITYSFFAHFLSPSDFGLMSMALVVTGFADIFRDLGLSTSIIQKQEVNDRLLSSVYWFNVLFGIIIALIIFFTANIFSAFYGNMNLVPILKALSVIFLLANLSNIERAILERELKFNRVYTAEIIAIIISSVIGVILAVNNWKVWSLVLMSISYNFVFTLMVIISSGWKPRLYLSFKEIKNVANFGINLSGFNIINYFARNADYIIIGKFLGAQPLGYYTFAYKIMLYPLQYIAEIVNKIMFPVLSRIQDDLEKFRSVYLDITFSIALITFPLMFGLMGVNKYFIYSILGARWAPVVPLIYILAPVGLMQSIMTTTSNIYLSKGQVNKYFYWGLGSSIAAIISFFIGIKWGIQGVALAYAIVNLVLILPGLYIPLNIIKLTLKKFLLKLFKPFVYALLMFLVILSFNWLLSNFITNNLIMFLTAGSIGAIFYIVCMFTFQKKEFINLYKTMFFKTAEG